MLVGFTVSVTTGVVTMAGVDTTTGAVVVGTSVTIGSWVSGNIVGTSVTTGVAVGSTVFSGNSVAGVSVTGTSVTRIMVGETVGFTVGFAVGFIVGFAVSTTTGSVVCGAAVCSMIGASVSSGSSITEGVLVAIAF